VVAELDVTASRPRLVSLGSISARSGHETRVEALSWLTSTIAASHRSLWGIDAPFGLPVELFEPGAPWSSQLEFVARWKGDAISLGRHLAARSLREFGAMHVRRETDRAARTPFDCYHYRIVHQTFHAMRDVLLPLSRSRSTAILPFQYARLARADRVVVEACPSSSLLRLGLPRRGYKQQGESLRADRVRVRRVIMRGILQYVRVAKEDERVMLADSGGDAIDAVLAAIGAMHAVDSVDHGWLARHPRARREGWVFA
jgi:hypothetical protein